LSVVRGGRRFRPAAIAVSDLCEQRCEQTGMSGAPRPVFMTFRQSV
jgi:hypothetical protein